MQGQSSRFDEEGSYYYCFYHVYAHSKHVNFHHVLMKVFSDENIKELRGPDYSYFLFSATPVWLSEDDRRSVINKGLIQDGETLLRRFRAQQNKN